MVRSIRDSNHLLVSILQSLALDCVEIEDKRSTPSKLDATNYFKHILASNFEEWIVLNPSTLHKAETDIAHSNLLFFQQKFVHLSAFPK